jgi:hypothetical protein
MFSQKNLKYYILPVHDYIHKDNVGSQFSYRLGNHSQKAQYNLYFRIVT